MAEALLSAGDIIQDADEDASVSEGNDAGDASFSDNGFKYNMCHHRRGQAIIINNEFFPVLAPPGNHRNGTEKDGVALKEVFTELGFDVHVHDNKKAMQMIKIVKDIALDNHTDRDCLLFSILSHGDLGDVWATDQMLPIMTLIKPIITCPTLLGKPKIILLQACQGAKLDAGVEVEESDADSGGLQTYFLHEPDVLIVIASAPGYYCFRRGSGSWLIQAVYEVFKKHGKTGEIQDLFRKASNIVAYRYASSNIEDPELDGKKQMPCFFSTLTKEVYFKPKSK